MILFVPGILKAQKSEVAKLSIKKSYISQVWQADNGDGTYRNPIIYADPDVIRVGDDFYMTASSFNCSPGLPILHSNPIGEILQAKNELWIGSKVGLFCTSESDMKKGSYADFDWFRIDK